MDLGKYLFEIVVSIIALIIIIGIWFINRRRKDKGSKVIVETGLIVLISTVMVALIVLLIQSPIASSNPLLFVVANPFSVGSRKRNIGYVFNLQI